MREKYESLALKDLKEIAKIRDIKGISSMSKAQVVDALLAKDEEDAKAKEAVAVEKTAKEETKEPKKSESVAKEVTESKKDSAVKSDSESKKFSSDEKPHKTRKNAEGKKTVSEKKSSKDSETVEAKAANTVEETSVDSKNGESKQVAKTDTQSVEGQSTQQDVQAIASAQPAKTDTQSAEGQQTAQTGTSQQTSQTGENATAAPKEEKTLDSGVRAHGILEVMPDGYGFIRCENFLPGENDVYVAPSQIRKFNLKTGDIIDGNTRIKTMNEKFSALLYLRTVNGLDLDTIKHRANFEDMTPIFPDSRIKLETPGSSVAMRVMDLLSPVGKGQRGMIVSPPKAGKTTLLKQVAKSVKRNHPDIHMIILLIDERPEEVTDIKEAIEGPNVEVIYSTFDELPEHHKRVSEMVIERAKRLVEQHQDVMILLDSITRLTRAYNLTVPPSGRTLSGGLDPAALHMPKRFFGAARNMREGGSLTILATALVDTGSKMDDVVYEEFKGTGNMEMVLDRKLSEKRIFPAIDIPKSGTRRDDLLLSKEEIDAVNNLRKGINGLKPDEYVDRILDMFSKTRSNADFIHMTNKIHIV